MSRKKVNRYGLPSHVDLGPSRYDLKKGKKLRRAWALIAAAGGLVLAAGGVYGYNFHNAAEQQRRLTRTWEGIARGLESAGGFKPGFDLEICPAGVGSNRVFSNQNVQNGVRLTQTVFFPMSSAQSVPTSFQMSFDIREIFEPITLHRRGESWAPDRGQSLPSRHAEIIQILHSLVGAGDETIRETLRTRFGEGNARFEREGSTNYRFFIVGKTGVPNIYKFSPGSVVIESGSVVARAAINGEGIVGTQRHMTGFNEAVNACAANSFTGGATPPSVAEGILGVEVASAASRIRLDIRP